MFDDFIYNVISKVTSVPATQAFQIFLATLIRSCVITSWSIAHVCQFSIFYSSTIFAVCINASTRYRYCLCGKPTDTVHKGNGIGMLSLGHGLELVKS